MPPRTILEVLKITTGFFVSHGVENPRMSAELLLAHALGTERLDLYLRFDQPLSVEELDRYRGLVRRRLRHEPVAYITGVKAFWDLTLAVTPEVLIPRPDTETLVETALAEITALLRRSAAAPPLIFEAATGSGAVILSLAGNAPAARFFASDVSPAALRLAADNARRSGLAERVCFFAGDWFSALRPVSAPFDLIVVNPPYVARGEIAGLAPDVRDYEPRAALDGGDDGLDHIRAIIAAAGGFLSPGGLLLLEIGWDQHDRVRTLAKAAEWCQDIVFFKDIADHQRVAHLRKRG